MARHYSTKDFQRRPAQLAANPRWFDAQLARVGGELVEPAESASADAERSPPAARGRIRETRD